jgi:hypothetical protein
MQIVDAERIADALHGLHAKDALARRSGRGRSGTQDMLRSKTARRSRIGSSSGSSTVVGRPLSSCLPTPQRS